jgi:hypothetical protein
MHSGLGFCDGRAYATGTRPAAKVNLATIVDQQALDIFPPYTTL